MTKICAFCEKKLVWPEIFNCYYCQKTFCDEHSIAENHECPKVVAAKHIEKSYLRRKDVNITTGRYMVICKNCGFSTDYFGIEEANQKRIYHMQNQKCSSKSVQLKQHEEDKAFDEEFVKNQSEEFSSKQAEDDWLYQCLAEAKSIINTHHKDESEFLSQCHFSFQFDQNADDAFGYLTGSFPNYKIGIHELLSDPSPEVFRFVTMTIVHELLHAIHSEWSEKKVAKEEYLLANKAHYFDTLQKRDMAYLKRLRNLKDLE